MPVADKIIALFGNLTPADLDQLPPAERRRFADMCRHWAAKAERPTPPRAGFIQQLERGDRAWP